MAQRMLSFIHSRAPRAIGVSDEAIDEHKQLIRYLYLTRKYTRDQVIAHLKTEVNFNLSPDQFSKAIRRWGFRKQFHPGKSTQPPPDTTASADTTTTTPSNDLSCTADTEHPATGPDHFPLPCPPETQPKPKIDQYDIPDIDGDGDITMSTPTDDKSIEPGLTHSSAGDLLDPADCLACCYDYTKKLDGYITLSISLEDLYACKERRARILDMARIATTRTNCEIVRLMLETELEMSEDPLDDKGHTRSLPKGAEMCRMQSFLFHRHLAQIYAHQNDGTISMQKHLDIARNFSDAFDTYGTDSIDLWTLLFLVQDKKYSQIPKELLGSLQWDHESYGLNIEHCLRYCWGILNPTKSLYDAFAVYTASIVYDAEQRTKTEPTEISDLVLEDSSFSLWKRSSILFTFLMQLTHGALFWMSGHPTISPAHILMIVSRMIVKRSSITSKHPDNLKEPEGHPLQIHPTSLKIYCDTILELLQYHYMRPNTKIEFVTQFLAHHTWYPASDSKRALASQTQSNPLEALKSVLAIRRDDFTADHLSTILEDWTPSSKNCWESTRGKETFPIEDPPTAISKTDNFRRHPILPVVLQLTAEIQSSSAEQVAPAEAYHDLAGKF
ncbi:hypothetical protein HG530_005593 [Fusarium avenaceum]|nr:hypothetical protein HG530_005593 [Fusarium avenaceum]